MKVKSKPPVLLSEAGLHDLLIKACDVANVKEALLGVVPQYAEFYIAALAKRFNVKCPDCQSLIDTLAKACVLSGAASGESYSTRGLDAQGMLALLNNQLKVKCPDCGHYPGERGVPIDDKGVYRVGELHDSSDIEYRWDVEELLSNEGVRVSRHLIGPVQAPEPPPITYMNHETILSHIKKLAGRVLTILDASFPTGSQRDALKSLIRREFRSELEHIGDFFYGPSASCWNAKFHEKTETDEITQEL